MLCSISVNEVSAYTNELQEFHKYSCADRFLCSRCDDKTSYMALTSKEAASMDRDAQLAATCLLFFGGQF